MYNHMQFASSPESIKGIAAGFSENKRVSTPPAFLLEIWEGGAAVGIVVDVKANPSTKWFMMQCSKTPIMGVIALRRHHDEEAIAMLRDSGQLLAFAME